MNYREYKALSVDKRKAIWPTLDKEIQKKIAQQRKEAVARFQKDEAMKSCGLTKVRGPISGKVYWE